MWTFTNIGAASLVPDYSQTSNGEEGKVAIPYQTAWNEVERSNTLSLKRDLSKVLLFRNDISLMGRPFSSVLILIHL
jgi:hypothetical protein